MVTCELWGSTADSGRVDNCYRDYAQTHAQDLMALLSEIDADLVLSLIHI